MNYCSRCGAKIVDNNAHFCAKCGNELEMTCFNIKQDNNSNAEEHSETNKNPKRKNEPKIVILICLIVAVSIMLIFSIMIVTNVICINHEWMPATCIEPAKCIKCSKYRDSILGEHIWSEATCQTPKKCINCFITEGEIAEHIWKEATCDMPAICTVCGAFKNQILGHKEGTWIITKEATLTENGLEEVTCELCKEIYDSRIIPQKQLDVVEEAFNFTDEEFVDWFNSASNANISKQSIDMDNLGLSYVSYSLTLSGGEIGVITFEKKDNIVLSISCYFDSYATASGVISWIGNKIDYSFSTDDVFYPLVVKKESYASEKLIATYVSLEDNMELIVLLPKNIEE